MSKRDLTPRERVDIALGGDHTDRVPFTMYESMVHQCTAERLMRNRGMCIVNRISAFRTVTPNVTVTEHGYNEGGTHLIRTQYDTPVGSVSTLQQPAGFTTWVHERMLKRPEDYKVLLFMIRDEQAEATYDSFARAQDAAGGDMVFRASFGLEPLQSLISGAYMDTATFCTEWMDRRDEVLRLYEAIVENQRKVYPLVAQSPAPAANYGGNVVPEIIGLDTFERYYVDHYNEAAEVMHKHGKLIGCHFDANCRVLAQAIAGTDLDYIEAFTPMPDTDMTLGEARRAWPGKTLWINFPSSLHLSSDEKIREETARMIDDAGSVDGLIFGITENIPPDRWQASCTAIMDGLDEHAHRRPDLYA